MGGINQGSPPPPKREGANRIFNLIALLPIISHPNYHLTVSHGRLKIKMIANDKFFRVKLEFCDIFSFSERFRLDEFTYIYTMAPLCLK